MTCYHPLKCYKAPDGKITFNKSEAWQDINRLTTVPCGQCRGCRLERSRQWAVRCALEAETHENNIFLTLTYNDKSLPKGGTLYRKHVQDFFKRLRKKYVPKNPYTPNSPAWLEFKRKKEIRYYGCGEYGEQLGRPHYHVCLFNFAPPPEGERLVKETKTGEKLYTHPDLMALWGHGHVSYGNVTFQSAAYVARYIMKKQNGPETDHYDKTDPETGEIKRVHPEFSFMSLKPGIGAYFLQDYLSDVYPCDEIILPHTQKRYKPPKYFDTLYKKFDEKAHRDLKISRQESLAKHASNNTPERLRVREFILETKLDRLIRPLPNEEISDENL